MLSSHPGDTCLVPAEFMWWTKKEVQGNFISEYVSLFFSSHYLTFESYSFIHVPGLWNLSLQLGLYMWPATQMDSCGRFVLVIIKNFLQRNVKGSIVIMIKCSSGFYLLVILDYNSLSKYCYYMKTIRGRYQKCCECISLLQMCRSVLSSMKDESSKSVLNCTF
jgi:hypothetical protein